MSSNVVQFNFQHRDVRIVYIAGEPWWVLADVCQILGVINPREAAVRMPEDDVGKTYIIDSMGREQEVLIVNEAGLYRLIFLSNKPEAEAFQRWVFSEVLPTIRKTGRYSEQETPSGQIDRDVDSWCAMKYAHRAHGGLGVSPFSKAMSWAAPIRRIESERALDLLLAPIAGQDGFRTVWKKGIRLERGSYFGAGLAGHVGQRVFCRCDPEDLGRIYVFTEDMAFICEARNIERLGVDRAAAAAQAVADQKRFARERIDPLRREMKKIDAYSVADTLRDLYARDNGAVSAFPKSSETHSTPALDAAKEAASPCAPAATATPEQEEGYRRLLEEYETARERGPAPPQSDEERWWARRERLEAALARGEEITQAEARWLDSTRNAYWVRSRKDFAAFAAQAGG